MKIEGNQAYFSSEFPKLRIKMNYSTPSFAGIRACPRESLSST